MTRSISLCFTTNSATLTPSYTQYLHDTENNAELLDHRVLNIPSLLEFRDQRTRVVGARICVCLTRSEFPFKVEACSYDTWPPRP